MRVCVFCKTHYQNGNGVTFHKFPTDSTQKIWLKDMKFVNWNPKTNYLCSKHFTDDCFIKHNTRTALKKCSVPTTFLVTVKAELSNYDCQQDQVSEINLEEVPQFKIDTDFIIPANTSSKFQRMGMGTPTPCVSETTTGVRQRLSSVINEQHITNLHCPSINYDRERSRSPKGAKTVSEICDDIKHDHRYENSSRSSKKALQRVKKALRISQSRVKVLSRRVKQLKLRVTCLKTVIIDLRKRKLIKDDFEE